MHLRVRQVSAHFLVFQGQSSQCNSFRVTRRHLSKVGGKKAIFSGFLALIQKLRSTSELTRHLRVRHVSVHILLFVGQSSQGHSFRVKRRNLSKFVKKRNFQT